MTLNEFLGKAGDLFKSQEKGDAAEVAKIQGELEKAIAESSKLQADLKSKEAELATANKSISDLQASAEKAKTDHATELKAKDESVQTLAAAKAAEITRGQGQPAVPATPAADATAPGADKPKLFGFAKVRAAFAEQLKTLK
jgi:chromosome segregation ATPase